ncbi:MAG: HAD-IA family hydrolase [Prevotella sp.]|nr:HAD-IA family hydrolase [Prevotella sp.]
MPKLFILDFDGTLADTSKVILQSMRQTIDYLHLECPAEEELLNTIGLPLRETFTSLFPNASSQQADTYVNVYRDRFNDNNHPESVPLFPHVFDTLQQLHQKGCLLSIASSRSRDTLADFIRRFRLDDIITFVVSANDVQHAKPHPEPVDITLNHYGITPEEAVVVGDAVYDILMGRNAGTRTCAVSYGNGSREEMLKAGADHVVDDFSELLSIAF